MKTLRSAVIAIVLILLSGSVTAGDAQWKNIKKFVQKDAVVLAESEDELRIFSKALQDTIVICSTNKPGADIYGMLAQRRGGNAYRIWVATETLWNNDRRPRKVWGKFFRTDFLKLIRPPRG